MKSKAFIIQSILWVSRNIGERRKTVRISISRVSEKERRRGRVGELKSSRERGRARELKRGKIDIGKVLI